MSTYPMSGNLPQSAKYLGEFVPGDPTAQYYYQVVAYDRTRTAISSGSALVVTGTAVLDGDHAVQISWSPMIGASFYNVYKGIGSPPTPTEASGIWWNASPTETGVLDVGYPCTTRNSFLNSGGTFTAQMFVPPPLPDCSQGPPPPCPPDAPCPDPAPVAKTEVKKTETKSVPTKK